MSICRYITALFFLLLVLISFDARAVMHADQGIALLGCNSSLTTNLALGTTNNPRRRSSDSCKYDPVQRGYSCEFESYNRNNASWVRAYCTPDRWHNYPSDKSCSSRPDTVGLGPWSSDVSTRTGTVSCESGCETAWYHNGDGTMTGKTTTGHTCSKNDKEMCSAIGGGYYWNAYLRACEPPQIECSSSQQPDGKGGCADQSCPDGKVLSAGGVCENKKGECPAGNIMSTNGTCLPGEGQCASGEARGADGTCKRDSDNDGTPDESEEDGSASERFSGGDTCDAPPSCSGSVIQCGMARIQWRIDCNTRRHVNISGGGCDAMPICTGKECNAMEYATLIQTWKGSCAMQAMAKKPDSVGGGPQGDANGNGVADVLEGRVPGTDPGEPDEVTRFGINVSASRLDSENIFGGGSCPEPPSFSYMGATISGADFPYWCQAMSLLRGLILVFGAFTALQILMGRYI